MYRDRITSNSTWSTDILVQAYQKKPELFQRLDGDNTRITPVEVPLAYSDVRLVHTLTDPITKRKRDVIVDTIKMGPVDINKNTGERKWERYIAGPYKRIEWPYDDAPEYDDHQDDTLRISVDEQTFVPTLLTPPMPLSVIDELRGKYSKYRTRHDEQYLAKQVEKEEALNARSNWESTMKMPVQLFHEKQKAEKEKRGEPQLTEDMLARIGEVMAANRAAKSSQTA
jgi:large subunit ribosomal protein L24